MKRFATIVSIIVVSALLLAFAGCWPLEYAEDEYREAIPRQEDLVVKIGENDADMVQTASLLPPLGALDPYAECPDCCIEEIEGEDYYVDGEIYQMTRDAKWHINGGLVVIMGWVSAIVNTPNPEETDTGYIWGPWQESLSRIEFRFVMDKTSADHFSFRLEGKNINDTSDNWEAVVDGTVVATSTPHAGSGTIVIDYDTIHEIDVSHPTPESGRIVYDFDVTGFPYTVETTFEDFEYWDGNVLDAVYSYSRFDDGMAGELMYTLDADVWPENAPDGQAEHIEVSSRWISTGEGHGEASVSGGTLDEPTSVVDSVSLEECWADSAGLFYATYESMGVEYNDGTGTVNTLGCGIIGNCPAFDSTP